MGGLDKIIISYWILVIFFKGGVPKNVELDVTSFMDGPLDVTYIII